MSSEIKKLRESAGLTQKEAANLLDMPRRRYGSYERGERTPRYDTMDEIRRVLGERADESLDKPINVTKVNAVHHYESSENESESIIVDERITGNGLPSEDRATAHRVNGAAMGAWMPDESYVIALDTDEVTTLGRYVVQWSESEDKLVLYMERHGNESLMVRTYSPRKQEVWTVLDRNGRGARYQRESGAEIDLEILGRVIVPKARGQQMTEEVSDHLKKVFDFEGGGN